MTDRLEDLDYKEDDCESPKAARRIFGEPPSWMEWVAEEGPGSEGSYSGIKKDVETKPFTFYGGGFDNIQKYIGLYIILCDEPIIDIKEKFLSNDLEVLYGGFAFHTFGFFFKYYDRTINEYKTIKCGTFPVDWYNGVEYSSAYKQTDNYKNEIDIKNRLKNYAHEHGYVPVIDLDFFEKHLIAKISGINDNIVYITTQFMGRKSKLLSEPLLEHNIRFEIPEEVKPYADQIHTHQLSMLGSPESSKDIISSEYLILKNGLYLKRIFD